ncbi:PhnB protein [Rhodococcus rhodochrous J3]|jgi:PhnB protein|uniref:VOC family protein n=2 Tax=Rhodococcus rhodochrous TaxID=1829 RepID=A0AA47A9K0_RHORH|nr:MULTISPECIES: VOC family protein [Rhodococcus]MBF4478125.1 VOC family protein [Rhodococcus rhodochrous]MCB8908688.1 VOC family protein [Rhodococcus rhodochrous]MCD2098729.1 VOC family protein [Rhodococcus rhodochrous]MCD2123213.1 VOC family protein [Rhodococcus rhodochrous]MCQ4137788.1 VOC family protein [Rhodococcus rhodochrous]
MTTRFNPYLAFRDSAREAMEFYRSVLGGELTVSTFGDMHDWDDPSENAKVMHSMLTTDRGFVLMASDTPQGTGYTPGTNFSLSLSGDDESVLRGWWDALTADGRVDMPLERAPWGDLFGMCTDRFGVSWMVSIGDQQG